MKLSTKPRPPIEGFESQLAEMLEKKDEVHLIQRDTPISLPELSQVDLDTLNAAPKDSFHSCSTRTSDSKNLNLHLSVLIDKTAFAKLENMKKVAGSS